MVRIDDLFAYFPTHIPREADTVPWEITANLIPILESIILTLDDSFVVEDGIAIHRSATVESGVTLKRPVIVMANCFIGAHAYFREGVFLDASVKIGPGSEIKSSIICSHTAIAHFNYIGNSIIGQYVNFEAGSIAANHYNERENKDISLAFRGQLIPTGLRKLGALVGDYSKVGANAVLSPGTLLEKRSIVRRLELIEQVKEG